MAKQIVPMTVINNATLHSMIMEAESVEQALLAYSRWAGSRGAHSGAPAELWDKLAELGVQPAKPEVIYEF